MMWVCNPESDKYVCVFAQRQNLLTMKLQGSVFQWQQLSYNGAYLVNLAKAKASSLVPILITNISSSVPHLYANICLTEWIQVKEAVDDSEGFTSRLRIGIDKTAN